MVPTILILSDHRSIHSIDLFYPFLILHNFLQHLNVVKKCNSYVKKKIDNYLFYQFNPTYQSPYKLHTLHTLHTLQELQALQPLNTLNPT